MQSFPRLTALFGVPVDALDASAIQSAIDNGIPEDFDLDWKEAHYPRDKKNPEIAKDVAQLANTSGGIIVLGVKEQNGCADRSSPVALGDDQERRIREIASERIRPFVTGLSFRSIETSPGMGYLIVVVPQSGDAPHAVVQENRALAYPVRDGSKTRWLNEYEVATRYRDRYQARSVVADRLNVVHQEGVSRIAFWRSPWLAVSLVPLIAGRRGIGSEALAAEQAFVSKWRETAPPQSPLTQQPVTVLPGIRRAIATEELQYAGRSANPHAELHYDGSGFGATSRPYELAGTNSSQIIDGFYKPEADRILQDAMELQILALITLLVRHAADTGVAGECLLRAHQLVRQQTSLPMEITPVQICETVDSYRQGRTMYQVVRSSVTVEAKTRAADTAVFIDDLASDARAVVRTSYGLAADILGEFGVAEPIILRPDGLLNVHCLWSQRAPIVAPWVQQKGLAAPDPAGT
jgi:hypothetical protein